MEPSSSGKKVAGNLYLHRDAVAGLESESRSEIWAAEAVANTSQWNVVKLRKTGQKRISLLTYEDFDRPFPVRDRIPQIIEASGRAPKITELKERALRAACPSSNDLGQAA